MKIIRYLFLAFLLLLAVTILWPILAPKEDISRRINQTIKEQEKRSDLLFKEVTFEEVLAGVKYWELAAEIGSVNKTTGLATLQKAHGTFYKKGRAVLRFHSPAALWDMTKKEIYLDQPVGYDVSLEKKIDSLTRSHKGSPYSTFNFPERSRKNPGYWFQARNLSWRLADQMLTCKGGIVLNKGEVTGWANQLVGDVGLETVLLEGNPHITMVNPHNSPVTLEAESFQVVSSLDAFIAGGNPVVTWQQARVVSQAARYQQRLKKIELIGNVRINYQDISAEGETADYYIPSQKVILSGQARAVQGSNQLSGSQVMVSLKENKISLVGKSRVIISGEEIKK